MTKTEALQYAKKAAQAADDKLGQNIIAIDVSKESTLADYFLFITGTSHVHIRAMEDGIREALRTAGASITRTDGQRGHVWRVLDYGSVLIHLMDEKTRDFYAIEKLWEKGRPVEWSTKKAPVARVAKAKAAKKSGASKAPRKKPAAVKRKLAKRRITKKKK